jgi:hypothetical protein
MAIRTLADVAANGKNENARVNAASELLNRGWGKAPSVVAGDEDGGPIRVVIRQIIERPHELPMKTVETIEHCDK